MYSVFRFSEWKKLFCVQHKMILKENDLFFLCSLIDYIARKTKNYRSTVVNALGENWIKINYDYFRLFSERNGVLSQYNGIFTKIKPDLLIGSAKIAFYWDFCALIEK